MIYAICNLNVVSWGTREVVQTPTEQKSAEEQKKAAELEKLKTEKSSRGYLAAMYDFFGLASTGANSETTSCFVRNCSCCCPPQGGGADAAIQLQIVNELRHVKRIVKFNNKRLEYMGLSTTPDCYESDSNTDAETTGTGAEPVVANGQERSTGRLNRLKQDQFRF